MSILKCLFQKLIRSLAEHICKSKEDLMETFSRNALTSFSSFKVAIVIKGLMIWGSKCHQNNSPVVCDGYVKYEEADVDGLVAI